METTQITFADYLVRLEWEALSDFEAKMYEAAERNDEYPYMSELQYEEERTRDYVRYIRQDWERWTLSAE